MAARPMTPARQDEIIDAAVDVFIERAWDDVRLEDVAARAKIDVSELRQLFPDREELYRAAVTAFANHTIGRAEAELPPSGARDQLAMVCARAWDTLLTPEFAGLHRVAVASKLKAPHLAQDFRRLYVDRWKALLDRVLTRGAQSGELRPNAAVAGRIISSSLLLQAIWCSDASMTSRADSRVVQELLDVVMEGIAK
jgi:TetR/AcrR family transcriptional repressor of mexJK operon